MRILNRKEQAVTRGVLDKDVHHEPDLIELTYVDDNNVTHTVFAHRDGPFKTDEDIVRAHRDGTLHLEDHDIDAPEQAPPPQGHAFDEQPGAVR